jgi:hypothetical protein
VAAALGQDRGIEHCPSGVIEIHPTGMGRIVISLDGRTRGLAVCIRAAVLHLNDARVVVAPLALDELYPLVRS